ncbi:hypothetical protein RhiirA4_459231 [Rhizophagus irregularis]|uniref:Uncharacterized protein n=1 Tax=Rhizophagus irregularis TaxID=588596 RepID=A0A2I1GDW5_9GLOM|nr:hypothetical protein RhiirA4_459231 [Rhizophagus irregularis]
MKFAELVTSIIIKGYSSILPKPLGYIKKMGIYVNQPTFLWKNIIKRFINDDEYKHFMNKCLKNLSQIKE